jgi:hypothetical protein
LEDLGDQLERLATGHLDGKVLFDPALATTAPAAITDLHPADERSTP